MYFIAVTAYGDWQPWTQDTFSLQQWTEANRWRAWGCIRVYTAHWRPVG